MNVLILEDEAQTAQLLREFIEGQDPQLRVIATLDSIETAVEYLQTHPRQPDLLFMDIQLADGLSFDIFKQVKIECPVIFCTAYDQYTLEAFKSNGIEYILKPFEEKDIRAALQKVQQFREFFNPTETVIEQLVHQLKPTNTYKTALLVRFRESMYPVAVKDIALLALENEAIYLYTFDKQRHAIFKTLDEIEQVLHPQQFFRINRQMLVNREAILEIQPFLNRKVILKLKVTPSEKVVVSRLKVSPFLDWIETGQ